MKWISVKDRLPEEGKTVLLTAGRDIHTGYYFDEIEEEGIDNIRETYRVQGFQHSCEACELDVAEPDFHITHWQPLPEPPKEK